MIGQLLNSFSGRRQASRGGQEVTSQIEDAYTKGLLFPDLPHLRDADPLSPASAAAEPPDCHMPADLDLEASRDVRILIAQGETAVGPLLLFDSKQDQSEDFPSTRHNRTGSRGEGTAHHSRTASGPPRQQYGRATHFASIPESHSRDLPSVSNPTATATLAARSRARRSSTPALPDLESANAHRLRDSDEIAKIALECMFENVPTTYKGISNKIKIVQRETRPYDSTVLRDGAGSHMLHLPTKVSHIRKPSTLSSSYTASEPPPSPRQPSLAVPEDNNRPDAPRRTVLITRTFSVKWTEDDAAATSSEQSDMENSTDRSIPSLSIDAAETKSAGPAAPRRLPLKILPKPPMFAITIALSLPVAFAETCRPESQPVNRRKGFESQGEWSSFGSSVQYDMTMDPLFGLESSMASLSSDVDDRVDKVIGQHWDILVRTLSSLQQSAESTIIEQLKMITRKGRPPKLLHNALVSDIRLRKEAEQACIRLVRGIRILRVRTGQGRWGVWREEARCLNRWVGDRDKSFLHNLCSAFLGTHTEWLDVAGPRQYRKQHQEQLRLGSSNEPSVPCRTVIVSSDKMIARRFIFLLSAFLPANHHTPGDASPLRPSTAASVRNFSQSPPTHLPLSREESLRRSINRRGKRSSSRQNGTGARMTRQSSTYSDNDDRTETGTVRGIEEHGHSRRGSAELRSLMRTKLIMTEADLSSRKSFPVISSTVAPGSTMQVPHIGFQRKYSLGADGANQPDSNESLATDNLMQTLQRSNTGASLDSINNSRWGSLRSLWSMGSRRDSSTQYSDATRNDDEGLGIVGLQHAELQSKLHQMVIEGSELPRMRSNAYGNGVASPTAIPSTPEMRSPEHEVPLASMQSQPIDVPIRMMVNEEDGVIDVEFPGFSPIVSPAPNLGEPSDSSFGSLGMLGSLMADTSHETGHARNVAGWLRVGLHPDFELQATPPYTDLIDDLKAAMRAESSPNKQRTLSEGDSREEWVDVCTSLIVDVMVPSIKRLRLRRRVRYLAAPPPPTIAPMPLPKRSAPIRFSLRSQYGNPYDDQASQVPTLVTLEEVFEEERVADLDRGLMDALERVMAHSNPSSKIPSASSSRANSVRGRPGIVKLDSCQDGLEVPHNECKKMVIGALEQIATSVERERRDARKYGGARLRTHNDEMESSLRYGIMRWYDEVEKNKKVIDARRNETTKSLETQKSLQALGFKRDQAQRAGLENTKTDAENTPSA